MRSFCNAKASLIFSTKNISVFVYKVVKHLKSGPLNELVKLSQDALNNWAMDCLYLDPLRAVPILERFHHQGKQSRSQTTVASLCEMRKKTSVYPHVFNYQKADDKIFVCKIKSKALSY